METVRYRGHRADLPRLLRQAIAIAVGREPDPTGEAHKLHIRVGNATLTEIQRDFRLKSAGGTGTDGVKWPPLQPATIAARKAFPKSGERGLLTPAQNKRWKQVYGTRLAKFRIQGVAGAEAIAARIAWATVKAEGAKTRLSEFGSRKVPIGLDSGAMYESLTPGHGDSPSGAAGQILELQPGAVAVGSAVSYFPRFNAHRQVYPINGSLPAAWWPAIRHAAQVGLLKLAKALLREGSR